eukprot:1159625-Pelagomonas_calceolata.AAC.8
MDRAQHMNDCALLKAKSGCHSSVVLGVESCIQLLQLCQVSCALWWRDELCHAGRIPGWPDTRGLFVGHVGGGKNLTGKA